jgi:hypothetical protein
MYLTPSEAKNLIIETICSRRAKSVAAFIKIRGGFLQLSIEPDLDWKSREAQLTLETLATINIVEHEVRRRNEKKRIDNNGDESLD